MLIDLRLVTDTSGTRHGTISPNYFRLSRFPQLSSVEGCPPGGTLKRIARFPGGRAEAGENHVTHIEFISFRKASAADEVQDEEVQERELFQCGVRLRGQVRVIWCPGTGADEIASFPLIRLSAVCSHTYLPGCALRLTIDTVR